MAVESISDKVIIGVIGLGYVGLPLATAFARHYKVIGFDVDAEKVRTLSNSNSIKNLIFTDNSKDIRKTDFVIICVPTPLTNSQEPDLTVIEKAGKTVGQNLKKDSVVILESTVYPGVTEEVLLPILEKYSGLKCGRDFKIGYSPERVNPGDDEHTIEKTTKVVSGMDKETAELIAELYGKAIRTVFIARDIRTAEAAKAIENIQRDMNIALVNEFAIIFEKMDLNTKDVLEAAGTKWNFHNYSPGLVGGHCIPVVPHYFMYKARELGYNPQIISAGRRINEYMPKYLAETITKALTKVGKRVKGSKVLIMGLTYKNNVADAQDSPIKDTISELRESGIQVYAFDPLLGNTGNKLEFKVEPVLKNIPQVDAIIVTVAHDSFKKMKIKDLKGRVKSNPILLDLKQIFDQGEAEEEGFQYHSL